MDVVIPRNSQIPASKEADYTTVYDNQTSTDIVIYEGERKFVNDNHKLGKFTIMGIAPEPAGIPRIKAKFEIDSNGILNVSAFDNKNP